MPSTKDSTSIICWLGGVGVGVGSHDLKGGGEGVSWDSGQGLAGPSPLPLPWQVQSCWAPGATRNHAVLT